MVALKGADIDRFIRSPDPRYAILLVYGPDAGLVHERCRTLARGKVENPDDPFQLIRMDGDDIGNDSSRIVDEANTLGLFGGKRAIWLRIGSRHILSALEPLWSEKPENPLIIEAGDLPAKHALRAQAEKSAFAMALPCYADEGRSLPLLIEEILGEHGLKASAEAKAMMAGFLGADRLLSRSEIEKLALFARGKPLITAEDVEEIMADASALATDRLIDAVFEGDSTGADVALFRSLKEGQDASVLLGALLRHAVTLSKSRIGLDRGQTMQDVERQARIFFKRSSSFQRQLSLWSLAALENAIATLGEAQMACRKNAALDESLISRACLTLAIAARRAQSGRP
jgi:DNA polymerase-3 subunit delta